MSFVRLRSAIVCGVLSLGLAGTAFGTPVSTAVITPGTETIVPSRGTPPGDSLDYDFTDFYNSALGENLTNVTFTDVDYRAVGVSSLRLNTPVGTPNSIVRAEIDTGNSTDSLVSFGTFTTTLDSFTIYMLISTNSAYPDTQVGLSVNGGTPVTLDPTATAGQLDFVSFHVTGVTSTDVFDISAVGDQKGDKYPPTMSGITFDESYTAPVDTPAVPEPSSFALLGTGVVGLVGAARRRFVKVSE